jgi:2-aminoadipate transaminase
MVLPMHDELHPLLSADARNFRPSAIRALGKLINDPAIVSFAGGMPSPATFPAEDLLACAQRVLQTRREVALQYGPTPGIPRLRETVAAICGNRKISCSGEQVIVTTGSQQAVQLVAHALLDPGDVVLVELPSYIGALSSFWSRRVELVGVRQDDEGLDPDHLREVIRRVEAEGRRIKLLYTIPNFQNPSGRLMVFDRRAETLAIAREHGFLVLEDDPYGELVYREGCDTTPIRAQDGDGVVIYLGSFSKILAPGLRCGWVLAPKALFRTIELAKEAADLCSGMLDQSIVDEFCASGLLAPQIAKVRDFYRERRATLISALENHFTDAAEWTDASGGLFTFLTLKAEVDTREWVPRAIEQGVAYVPGAPFFVDGSGANTMRLTFAKEPDERMREGVARLARLFAA